MIYNEIIYRTDASFDTEIVETLPSTDLAKLNTIYFVKNNDADNTCSEYLCIKEGSTRRWELIGTTAVTLSDYVKKTDVKPLYVHNITLHYKHSSHPNGGDGECRASFVLINTEDTSYSMLANNVTTADSAARQSLLKLFRAVISETNKPTGLSALPALGSKNHLIPCSGVTVAPLTANAAQSFCVNSHIGAKYFRYNDGDLKRLLIIYGYPTTGKVLTAATSYQSALEISCGLVEAEEDGTDPIFNSDKKLEDVAKNNAEDFAGQYIAVTDLMHQLSII